MPQFTIREKPAGNAIVLECAGELDFSTYNHGDETVKKLVESGAKKIIFDLGAVKYISSSGWTVFLGNLKQARSKSGNIVLAAMQKEVKAAFKLLELDNLLDYYESVEEAIKKSGDEN